MPLEPLHIEEWGAGDPLIALHPLALDSQAFAGVARVLARQGLRTLAVDLPGFGKTPAPDGVPLTPARLAAPVLELARSLERPPLLLGMSMGGRVALEAALTDPQAVRGTVLVAPFLPWRHWRPALAAVKWLDPDWAEWLPLERAWPVLKRLADAIDGLRDLEHDWLARASARFIYYTSCPATRVAFLSAAREMALDPATGPRSLWTRLPELAGPATFLWAGRDGLIPRRHAGEIEAVLPWSDRIEVPCAGHFVSGQHFRCMRHAIALAVEHTLAAEREGPGRRFERGTSTLAACLADARELDEELDEERGERPSADAAEPDCPRAAGARGGSR